MISYGFSGRAASGSPAALHFSLALLLQPFSLAVLEPRTDEEGSGKSYNSI